MSSHWVLCYQGGKSQGGLSDVFQVPVLVRYSQLERDIRKGAEQHTLFEPLATARVCDRQSHLVLLEEVYPLFLHLRVAFGLEAFYALFTCLVLGLVVFIILFVQGGGIAVHFFIIRGFGTVLSISS